MRAAIFLSATLAACNMSRENGGYIEAFSSPIIIIAPQPQQFSSLRLHAAEQPNNALLSDLKEAQLTKEEEEEPAVSSSDYFIADSFNDDSTATAMAEELKGINTSSSSEGNNKLMAADTTSTEEERPLPPAPPKQKKLIPTPPPLVFDPANPKAMIAIVKSFIATDFGIQAGAAQVRIFIHMCLMKLSCSLHTN